MSITYNIRELRNYTVIKFDLTEKINGVIPKGTLVISQNPDDIDLSINTLNISFIVNDEYEFNMIGSVIDVIEFYGKITYSLAFVPKEFYTELKKRTYEGVDSLINSLYPYNIVGDSTNDAGLNEVNVYQNNVTDADMFTRYIMMMKRGKIFSVRFDSLFLTQLGEGVIHQMDLKFMSRDLELLVSKSKYLTIEPTKNDYLTNGLSVISYNSQLVTCDSHMSKAYMNKLFNENKYNQFSDCIEHEFNVFTGLRAGDQVQAETINYENNTYLVTSYTLKLDSNKKATEYIKLGSINNI